MAEAPFLGTFLWKVNKLNPKFIHCCLLTANQSDVEVRWHCALPRVLGIDKNSLCRAGQFPSLSASLPDVQHPWLARDLKRLGGPGELNLYAFDLNGLPTSTEKSLRSGAHTEINSVW